MVKYHGNRSYNILEGRNELPALLAPPQHLGMMLHIWSMLKIFVDQCPASLKDQMPQAISKIIFKKLLRQWKDVHFVNACGLLNENICFLQQSNTSSVKRYSQMLSVSNVPQALFCVYNLNTTLTQNLHFKLYQ